ncbi:anthranilate synthase component I family protein [Paenibacillus sp. YPG26]|uniref:anthranilate synthase component I family protein n=1 Tax=Paenibacillus sp. YPG26 TaxID=2878915 RepID=UPI0020413DE0|nr:anthranilate synthase component I family protein [Paenibacillus sp. YPG26]USB33329.1 anthranilate synthase component I family protein [Paenibacillus sp. YPG26]
MKVLTALEHWQQWAGEAYTLLPLAVRISSGENLPLSWKQAWEYASSYSFVLESGKDGKYTFLGLNPVSVIRGKGNRAEISDLSTGERSCLQGAPLDMIRRWMAPYKAPLLEGLPKFSGGCVGFLGYDVARSLENLPEKAIDDLKLDDYVWMRLEELWIVDQEEQEIYAVVHVPLEGIKSNEGRVHPDKLSDLYQAACQRAVKMCDQWENIKNWGSSGEPAQEIERRRLRTQEAQEAGQWPESGLSTSFEQKDFENAVTRIQQYISAGDVFQANLSLRQQRKLSSTPEEIYEWLRYLNPSPYMGLLRFPEYQLVSGSPELLVKLEQGEMSARPIAGTRRRGRTAEEDRQMAEELRSSEKERAEHIMLVDLERNDLGRVAAYGSVKVSELLTVEYYSHVMHLVSEVKGQLAAGRSLYEVIAAKFPGGTITGAPKVRTMEIIEELEPVTRGPYTGSMGWIDYRGNMELNIIIRTLVVKDEVGYIQTGAGIVIDSDPYREYRECHNKARAMALAVELSEEAVQIYRGQEMLT